MTHPRRKVGMGSAVLTIHVGSASIRLESLIAGAAPARTLVEQVEQVEQVGPLEIVLPFSDGHEEITQ